MLNSLQVSMCAEGGLLDKSWHVLHFFSSSDYTWDFSSVLKNIFFCYPERGCADENSFQDCFRTLFCHNILVCHLLYKLAMNSLLMFHCLTSPDHVWWRDKAHCPVRCVHSYAGTAIVKSLCARVLWGLQNMHQRWTCKQMSCNTQISQQSGRPPCQSESSPSTRSCNLQL